MKEYTNWKPIEIGNMSLGETMIVDGHAYHMCRTCKRILTPKWWDRIGDWAAWLGGGFGGGVWHECVYSKDGLDYWLEAKGQ